MFVCVYVRMYVRKTGEQMNRVAVELLKITQSLAVKTIFLKNSSN